MRIESICEFVDFVQKWRPEPQQAVGIEGWFRGQANSEWPAIPGALRPTYIEKVGRFGKKFNNQFRRLGAPWLPPGSGVVEIYFLGQHHGVPTRLMDWTTNGLAALFFAVCEEPEKDGAVFMFGPSCCTYKGFGIAETERWGGSFVAPFDMRHPIVEKAVKKLFDEGIEGELPPLMPIVPDLRYSRMFQQQSCFTLHMDDNGEIPETLQCKYIVPRERKNELLQGLRALGVSWATLFPDLDHVAREVQAEWGF